jgi:retron-type reverse transcriptase
MTLFEQVCSWANLLQAARKARRGKRNRSDVALFHLDLERNLLQLQAELRERTYRPGPYHTHYVHEPKKRLISAAPYRDRVVHHALIGVMAPLFERNFVFDSYANRIAKGTHAAVDRYHEFAKKYRYVLQCDIQQFFPSIDHEVLKQQLRSRIRDRDVLWLADMVIDGSNPQDQVLAYFPQDDLFGPFERRRGLPIGNLTSQFWANVYLHGLDQFVKRGLRCGGYVRYVDDFLVFGDDKARLHASCRAIEEFLCRLRLRVHSTKTQIRPTRYPIRFLGYRCRPDHRFLIRENIRRFRRRARRLEQDYAVGRIGWDAVKVRLQSWNAHAATAKSWKLRCRELGRLRFVRGSVIVPCSSRRLVEQQCEQLPVRESQQEHAGQSEQQQRVPGCLG